MSNDDREMGELIANVKTLLKQNEAIFEWMREQVKECEKNRANCGVKTDLKEHKDNHKWYAVFVVSLAGLAGAAVAWFIKSKN